MERIRIRKSGRVRLRKPKRMQPPYPILCATCHERIRWRHDARGEPRFPTRCPRCGAKPDDGAISITVICMG